MAAAAVLTAAASGADVVRTREDLDARVGVDTIGTSSHVLFESVGASLLKTAGIIRCFGIELLLVGWIQLKHEVLEATVLVRQVLLFISSKGCRV